MEGVHKRFGRVVALEDARLSLRRGEVHTVLGENGAGKTTLLGVLAGLVRADAGAVEVRGQSVRIRSPRDAWAHRIGMVHQHFALVPSFSALENLALGTHTGLSLPLAQARSRALQLMDETGLRVDLDTSPENSSVGERQRLEILKALIRLPEVLILDEPTAVLTPPEIERLLGLLERLSAGGLTVVLVAHKLDEVLSVTQRVTVLREGSVVLEAERDAVDADVLVKAMVGGDEEAGAAEVRTAEQPARPPRSGSDGYTVARLSAVCRKGSGGRPGLEGVDLEVRRGEIVGVVGVEGNSQRELAHVLSRRASADAGIVELPADPGLIPQDRSREGLIGEFSLTENVTLALHRDTDYRLGPFLRWSRLNDRTRELVQVFGVKAPGPSAPVHTLSGGNQQRVIVAREVGRDPELLVAETSPRSSEASYPPACCCVSSTE